MTLDNVFQWSQEAGVASGSEPVNITALQRFAALVAAAEREEILKLTDSLGWVDSAAIRARGET